MPPAISLEACHAAHGGAVSDSGADWERRTPVRLAQVRSASADVNPAELRRSARIRPLELPRALFGTKRSSDRSHRRMLTRAGRSYSRAEYVPKSSTRWGCGPAQSRVACPFTRRLLCQLSYTGG